MPSNVSKTFYFSGNQKNVFAYFKAIGTTKMCVIEKTCLHNHFTNRSEIAKFVK